MRPVHRAFVLPVLAGLVGAALASAQTPPAGPLQNDLSASFLRQIERTAASVDGVVGYVVRDLTAKPPHWRSTGRHPSTARRSWAGAGCSST